MLAMLGIAFAATAQWAAAGEEAPGRAEAIRLWPGDAPGAVGSAESDVPLLYAHPAPAYRANGAAVIVCPGGGYAGLAIGYEGHEVAQWLNKTGISAFVLVYRHAPAYKHPVPLQDAQRAIQLVRSRAAQWKVDPDRIGILGFSAGGHLSAMAGVHPVPGDPAAADPVEQVSSRPDFLVLLYPVISMEAPEVHGGSLLNLLGEDPDPVLVSECSAHLHVNASTPPAFLVHTTADEAVPVKNSLLFYEACVQSGVPAEMHLFEKGRHGLGMGGKRAPNNSFSEWPSLCLDWLRGRGLIPPEQETSGGFRAQDF